MQRRFGHYESIVYDLKAPKPVATRPEARPDYTRINRETEALENVASLGSQFVIAAAMAFLFISAVLA